MTQETKLQNLTLEELNQRIQQKQQELEQLSKTQSAALAEAANRCKDAFANIKEEAVKRIQLGSIDSLPAIKLENCTVNLTINFNNGKVKE